MRTYKYAEKTVSLNTMEAEEMKFSGMSNRELFCVLTGDYGVLAQAQLQDIIKMYLKYSKTHKLPEDVDLKTMVAECLEGKYDLKE